MSRSVTMVGVVIALSTWLACAASGARHTPVLYRTINQDRAGWLAFLRDNRTLVCGHRDGTASEYDIKSGWVGVEFNFGMNSRRYASSGRWLYSVAEEGTSNGMLEGVNAMTLDRQGIYSGRAPHPESLWVSADGSRLLIKAHRSAGTSRIVDVASGRIVGRVRALPAGAAFSPNLRLVAYRSGRSVVIADTHTGAIRRRLALRGTDGSALRMAFSPDGRILAVTSAGGFQSMRGIAGFTYRFASGERRWIHAQARGTEQLVWAPHDRWLLLSARNTDLAELVDTHSDREIGGFSASAPGTREEIQGLAFSRDNRWMAICSADGEIKVYQLPR